MREIGEKMKKIIVTGATGGLGSVLVDQLLDAGYAVHEFSRNHCNLRAAWTFFDLRTPTITEISDDVFAVIHCAYDFSVKNWREVCRVNVNGTLEFFRLVKQRNSPLFIFISSMAAFDGTKSHYGQGKRKVEQVLLAQGAICVRPGLIYGVKHGLVERIHALIVRGGIIPLINGGKLPIYPISATEVSEGIIKILREPKEYLGQPVILAPSRAILLRDLVNFLVPPNPHWRIYVSVPWWIMWLLVRLVEGFGIVLSFKSDSLIGLRFQNLNPFDGVLRVKDLEIKPLTES